MKLLILGAGGYGRTVADLAKQTANYQRIAFLDDQAQGAYILGKCSEYRMFTGDDVQMYPAFGNNEIRLHWLRTLEGEGIVVPSLIHPTAYVSPTATIGTGTVLLPKAVINTDCVIGSGCIQNCGSIVDHGCILEDGVHVCLGAIVKAENRIPEGMKIEAGQVVENRRYPI